MFSLCLVFYVSQYWRSDIAVDKKHFELFRKKLVLPLLIHSTAAARKSEGLGSVNPIVSNHILSFLQRFHPPFSNPPRHTRTHTHQRYGHQDFQVRKQTSQGQGPFRVKLRNFDDSRLYTIFDRAPTDAYGMSWRILQHARIDCTCWWPSASTWLTMHAFGVQPALVCALIDQTRGVFFARAHTDKASETK